MLKIVALSGSMEWLLTSRCELSWKPNGAFEYTIEVTGGELGEKGNKVAKGEIIADE